MSLTLHYHPLSSFCWKVLIALYELDEPFTPHQVDLSNPAERAALAQLWAPARFPVLEDVLDQWGVSSVLAESSIIIEYLAERSDRRNDLIPDVPGAPILVRARDRLFDLDLHLPMQKIVGDRLRPEGQHDPFGVTAARAQIRTGYGMVEKLLTAPGDWICGERFTMADCAAAPALAYANAVEPIGDQLPRVTAYLARLRARPSFARVLAEARPYAQYFPGDPALFAETT